MTSTEVVKTQDKKIKGLEKIKTVFNMEFPSGEGYMFDKQVEPEDLTKISEIWQTIRTEEIVKIEMDAKYKILKYLQDKGYKLIYQEKIKFI